MNRKFVMICICAIALGLAGLQAFAQDKPDQSSQQPADRARNRIPAIKTNLVDSTKPAEQSPIPKLPPVSMPGCSSSPPNSA